MNILADATLPGLEDAFPYPFNLTLYHDKDELRDLIDQHEVLLCRATITVNENLLRNSKIRYVATATSGTDHIDHSYLKTQHIKVIDAKGANADAVADYVTACLAYLEQQHLMPGNNASIIGMGHVGQKVANRLHAAQFKINAYDPLKAQLGSAFNSCDLKALYDSDLICIHAELHNTAPYPSYNLIDQEFLAKLKTGCVIINAARGGIVNEDALLNTSNSLIYCTDVYLNEPAIDARIINKATICTPHIAGHSLEAKYNAVRLVSKQLHILLGFKLPKYAEPGYPKFGLDNKKLIPQEQVLSLYNPIDETMALKQATDLSKSFLELRAMHNKRHDFALGILMTKPL